jgi:hypothetical protein
MPDRPENPPAFPQAHGVHVKPERSGMSLRDWFAGQALAGLCAAGEGWRSNTTEQAYHLAADMLTARKAGGVS